MNNSSPAVNHDDLDMTRFLLLGLSFFGGVLLTFLVLGIVADEPDYGAVGRQLESPDPVEQLARSVGEPGAAVEIEVAGVQCEAVERRVVDETTPSELLSLWNQTIQLTGDECNPDFANSLGRDWLLTDTLLTVFNDSGSLYEVETTNDVVTSISLYLVPDDADHSNELVELLVALWGADNVDWDEGCEETDLPWSGIAVPDGLYIEISLCDSKEA